jgi:AcrR family transcriptional regulator
VNREEAKDILLLYRHHNPADEGDAQVMEALALAKTDPELAQWLEMHCARQFVLREKFRQIPVPEGLKEQIISEHAAGRRGAPRRRQAVMAAAMVMALALSATAYWFNHRPRAEDNLPVYQSQMVAYALRDYQMDLVSNDGGKIRDFLKAKSAPADYVLPAGLEQAAVAGCAVQGWGDKKVSMICFRTGRPLQAGVESDLWLFIVDQQSVKEAPTDAARHLAQINRLVTATWARDGKLFFLGIEGGATELGKYL